MSALLRPKAVPGFCACLVAGLLMGSGLRAEEFEAVASKTSPDYVRRKAPDGSFPSESYAFAKGGYWSGPIFDRSIDTMNFMEIARTLAVPLAREHYLPTADPNTTELLLVVYWGTTYAPEHASESNAYNLAQKKIEDERESNQRLVDAERSEAGSQQSSGSTSDVRNAKVMEAQRADDVGSSLAVAQAENRSRDQADLRNAEMLGYDSEWSELMGGLGGPSRDLRKANMISELEEDRYFVVIMAYDYQLLVKEKKHKLLWETRFSIRQHQHAFNQQLASMAAEASPYFGQDSNGLTHKPLPEGKVEVGPVRNLGVVGPEPAKAATPTAGK